MTLSLRTQRLKLTWLLAVPFLWLSRPTAPLLVTGFMVAFPGVLLRAWASGHIEKDRVLATSGPYARIRHPLYVGSFLLGSGLAVAGGRWFFLPVFWALFTAVYGRTLRAEERDLDRRFGEDHHAYAGRVPSFLPGSFASGAPEGAVEPFRRDLFYRNRGWEAGAGLLAGLLLLWLKAVWGAGG